MALPRSVQSRLASFRLQTSLTERGRTALREAGAVVVSSLGIMTTLALLSYTPSDASLNQAWGQSAAPPANWIGPMGALWADLCLQVMGVAAWMFDLALLWVGARMLLGRHRWPSRRQVVATAGLAASCGTLIELLTVGNRSSYPLGGVFGALLARSLREHFAPVGAATLAATGALLSLTVCLGGVLSSLARRGGQQLGVWHGQAQTRVQQAVARARTRLTPARLRGLLAAGAAARALAAQRALAAELPPAEAAPDDAAASSLAAESTLGQTLGQATGSAAAPATRQDFAGANEAATAMGHAAPGHDVAEEAASAPGHDKTGSAATSFSPEEAGAAAPAAAATDDTWSGGDMASALAQEMLGGPEVAPASADPVAHQAGLLVDETAAPASLVERLDAPLLADAPSSDLWAGAIGEDDELLADDGSGPGADGQGEKLLLEAPAATPAPASTVEMLDEPLFAAAAADADSAGDAANAGVEAAGSQIAAEGHATPVATSQSADAAAQQGAAAELSASSIDASTVAAGSLSAAAGQTQTDADISVDYRPSTTTGDAQALAELAAEFGEQAVAELLAEEASAPATAHAQGEDHGTSDAHDVHDVHDVWQDVQATAAEDDDKLFFDELQNGDGTWSAKKDPPAHETLAVSGVLPELAVGAASHDGDETSSLTGDAAAAAGADAHAGNARSTMPGDAAAAAGASVIDGGVADAADGGAPIVAIGHQIPAAQRPYVLPPRELLHFQADAQEPVDAAVLQANADKLTRTLADYGIEGHVREIRPGPVVTMYEFVPGPGIKLAKIASLADDLAMSMEAFRVRIVAPIPGKGAVGIEIPNDGRELVHLKEIVEDDTFTKAAAPLTMALGKDIEGGACVADLARMPHLLVAGATGAGKSVSVNAMIMSVLFKATPEEVRMIMVDPKMLELSVYEGIPHLLLPVVTDPKKAALALRWAVEEMERRYELLSEVGVRSIDGYNAKVRAGLASGTPVTVAGADDDMPRKPCTTMPYLLVIVDELADLMMVASRDVEASIMRLAQMARAAGIHLILATQRPSVDVLTGVIKANFPTRIAFQVASRHDSRTIIDTNGAEHLLGRGDMLYMSSAAGGIKRVHGAYVSEADIERTVAFVRDQGVPSYDESILASRGDEEETSEIAQGHDEMYDQAVSIVAETQQASISMIQRRLRIGYNRAARMVECMEVEGIVGPGDGQKPREVFVHHPSA